MKNGIALLMGISFAAPVMAFPNHARDDVEHLEDKAPWAILKPDQAVYAVPSDVMRPELAAFPLTLDGQPSLKMWIDTVPGGLAVSLVTAENHGATFTFAKLLQQKDGGWRVARKAQRYYCESAYQATPCASAYQPVVTKPYEPTYGLATWNAMKPDYPPLQAPLDAIRAELAEFPSNLDGAPAANVVVRKTKKGLVMNAVVGDSLATRLQATWTYAVLSQTENGWDVLEKGQRYRCSEADWSDKPCSITAK